MTDRPNQRPVVFSPGVFASALVGIPAAGQALAVWRDGEVRLAIDRLLIVRYLRLLSRLGLPENQVRRWSWWLTSPDRAVILPTNEAAAPQSGQALLESIARQADAEWVVFSALDPPPCRSGQSPDGEVCWAEVEAFVRSRYAGDQWRSN